MRRWASSGKAAGEAPRMRCWRSIRDDRITGWWNTASSDQQQAFFTRSVEWLADKYGADNIVTATVHRDELTPHLSAFVVPRTADGRLSAKEFKATARKMRDDQTTYAERVADLGLERGIEGSRATPASQNPLWGDPAGRPRRATPDA